ncbi:MAG: bacteriohemerythrin [Zoogloeaceae bacterium]|jgi:hemerythrin|nr:bacteriohemerythrin [Zoogloeaceae bacterium]
MPRIEWNSSLSVGVEVIDKQHMRLIDYINELYDAIHSSTTVNDKRHRIASVVNDAIDYTESHFGFEETMLEEAHYPYLKAHIRVHQLFVRRMLDYKKRLLKGEDIAQELLETLGRWLINHIKNEDKDYSKWLVDEGKKPEATENSGWLSKQLSRFFGSSS